MWLGTSARSLQAPAEHQSDGRDGKLERQCITEPKGETAGVSCTVELLPILSVETWWKTLTSSDREASDPPRCGCHGRGEEGGKAGVAGARPEGSIR